MPVDDGIPTDGGIAVKISELLGDSGEATDPATTATLAPPTAARAQLSALAAELPVPTDEATEVAHEVTPDPVSAMPDDGGMKDLEAMMGTAGEIVDADAPIDGSETPTVLEPAIDDLLPALRGRAGSRSGSRRRGR